MDIITWTTFEQKAPPLPKLTIAATKTWTMECHATRTAVTTATAKATRLPTDDTVNASERSSDDSDFIDN